MKGIIRLGDRTSSNGRVLSASSRIQIQGKGAARVGDTCSCPKHGTNQIAEGSTTVNDQGQAIAFHGHRLSCGCLLITSLPNISIG
ncbi:PAAR domain-containing protein [Providencia rettgeri]|uniref:PAAR domain-containing protein n=1 Tax=Providencia rettgeri TaxID=587 RepID=UPI002360269D|nr:PAAR domain-containing protein [Providencia rettgeri]ELR5233649.1 PAAR domain-containing protein [Providencia rettgeri]MDR2224823.1 PAAR domain-containing protein [Providencia sp.]